MRRTLKASLIILMGLSSLGFAQSPDLVARNAEKYAQLPDYLLGIKWASIPKGTLNSTPIEAFHMSQTEVTVVQYKAYVDSAGDDVDEKDRRKPGDSSHSPYCNWGRKGHEDHPINCVSWDQAQGFADWLSKETGYTITLPSEDQWEYAARSAGAKDDRGSLFKYPWGNQPPDSSRAVYYPSDGTETVYSKPKGQSLQGVWGLAGNVWEWTSTSAGPFWFIWGGSWKNDAERLTDRSFGGWGSRDNYDGLVGFRLVSPLR
ncbi:MAG: SUMF1/EgtB/PvdO family nonheme iron enzyme [Elusimicrobia bacterium]|nr:SUMF1/EgtB/PvdO family nonheme iron enzyme [Elusimicrobiota bacterium]